MGQKVVSPGWEWQEGRGVKEAKHEETAVWSGDVERGR
jgi:hypothetical protein